MQNHPKNSDGGEQSRSRAVTPYPRIDFLPRGANVMPAAPLAFSVCLLAAQSPSTPAEEPLSYDAALALIQPGNDKLAWKSMVNPAKLHHLYESVMQNISSAEHPVRGDFVECGVWRGGAAMMMLFAEQAALARNRKPAHRDMWLFDTFEGMTVPEERDGGRAARRWKAMQSVTNNSNGSSSKQARTAGWSAQDFATGGDGGEYVDASGQVRWNYGPIDVVRQNVASTKYPPERVHYTKGKVEDTLTSPGQQLPKKIALLRLDTDWFNSTMTEFRILAPRLSAGALLIVDDYCTWQGARRATNEFLAKHRNHFFLEHQGLEIFHVDVHVPSLILFLVSMTTFGGREASVRVVPFCTRVRLEPKRHRCSPSIRPFPHPHKPHGQPRV